MAGHSTRSTTKKNGAPYGERHGKVRFSDAVVREVRQAYFDRGESCHALSAEHGVPYYTIRDWVQMKTRVHS